MTEHKKTEFGRYFNIEYLKTELISLGFKELKDGSLLFKHHVYGDVLFFDNKDIRVNFLNKKADVTKQQHCLFYYYPDCIDSFDQEVIEIATLIVKHKHVPWGLIR